LVFGVTILGIYLKHTKYFETRKLLSVEGSVRPLFVSPPSSLSTESSSAIKADN
jgi:hypothetical protein